jgi:ribosomal protein S18 acetylase RimI-like enzyme
VTRRRPTEADAAAVVALMAAYDTALGFEPDTELGDLLDEWRELDLSRDAWLWEEGGTPIAFASVRGRGEKWHLDGYVHPGHTGRGLGAEILRLAEERAREGGGARVQSGTLHADGAARALFEGHGFAFVRAFLRMGIQLPEDVREPSLEPGLRLVVPDDDAEVHAVVQEAFADHWDHQPRSLEDFLQRHEGVDRSLWRGVRDGDRLVAVSVNELRFGGGWVARLGTLRAWRGRGLASALLQAAFAEFRRRGETSVQLGVDAESPTGAVRIYERAGMHVVWRADVFEKHL